MSRNEHAAALRVRAGNAGTAIAVDTRPKKIPNKKRRNDRKAAKQVLRCKKWSEESAGIRLCLLATASHPLENSPKSPICDRPR